jgi:hypothetical protein
MYLVPCGWAGALGFVGGGEAGGGVDEAGGWLVSVAVSA